MTFTLYFTKVHCLATNDYFTGHTEEQQPTTQAVQYTARTVLDDTDTEIVCSNQALGTDSLYVRVSRVVSSCVGADLSHMADYVIKFIQESFVHNSETQQARGQ
jgi:hypothetical protein